MAMAEYLYSQRFHVHYLTSWLTLFHIYRALFLGGVFAMLSFVHLPFCQTKGKTSNPISTFLERYHRNFTYKMRWRKRKKALKFRVIASKSRLIYLCTAPFTRHYACSIRERLCVWICLFVGARRNVSILIDFLCCANFSGCEWIKRAENFCQCFCFEPKTL